ncbi:tyrosine-type recombinase/integrase [Bosea sp. LjRoot237]|uniref:tyrosine-type recombinase/integrase n=1 Tax=Bosea sp. LjRoot237 TaxID=3342292 RepID=UPI003ECDC463
MPRVRLTDRFVAAAKSDGAQVDFFDEQVPGLFLRVSASRRAWGLVFSRPGERTRARTTFGSFPSMSLSAARGRAIELKSGLDEGRDASVAVREIKSGLLEGELTVKRLAELFLADRRQRGRRTVDEMERCLARDVTPVIGSVAISKVRRLDLSRCTDRVKGRGAGTHANRVAALLRSMLGWGVDQGLLEVDPSHRWKPPSEVGPPRERAFSADEIKRFWHGLETGKVSRWTAELLRFTLVMGCRQGEAAGMVRAELDMERKLWRLPASRSKNGRPHDLPLPELAIDVLKPVLSAHELPAVFPGPRGLPMANTAISRAVQRSQEAIGLEKWTAHDLRRTCATHMAELGVSAFDIGLVLNHASTTKSTVTTATYIKHDYLKEKTAALDLWSERLSAILAELDAAEIVPMSKARRRYGLRKAAA